MSDVIFLKSIIKISWFLAYLTNKLCNVFIVIKSETRYPLLTWETKTSRGSLKMIPFLLTFNSSVNAITDPLDINQIAIDFDTAGHLNGTLDLSGGTNAAPTGTGITAVSNLITKGWTVTTN